MPLHHAWGAVPPPTPNSPAGCCLLACLPVCRVRKILRQSLLHLRLFAFRRADSPPDSRDSPPPSPDAACGSNELEQQSVAGTAADTFHEVDLGLGVGGRCSGGGSSGLPQAPVRTARARHAHHPLALRCACLAAPLE